MLLCTANKDNINILDFEFYMRDITLRLRYNFEMLSEHDLDESFSFNRYSERLTIKYKGITLFYREIYDEDTGVKHYCCYIAKKSFYSSFYIDYGHTETVSYHEDECITESELKEFFNMIKDKINEYYKSSD